MNIDDGICMCRFLSEGIDAKHVCISTWWAPWLPSPPFVASCSLLPLPDDSTQVIASKLRRKCPCFAILHDPWLPVSSNAGNETMIPSFGSPRSSRLFCRPSLHYPPRGRRWMVVRGPGCAVGCRHCWCQNIKCRPGCTGGCHHYLMVPEYQMPGGSHRCCHSPLIDG